MHDMRPQPAGVIVTAVEGHPSERPVLPRAGPPLRHEGGLAETCWSFNEDELGGGATQVPDELAPLHPLLAQAGSMELGLHRHAGGRAGRRTGHRPQSALTWQNWVAHLCYDALPSPA